MKDLLNLTVRIGGRDIRAWVLAAGVLCVILLLLMIFTGDAGQNPFDGTAINNES